jgi:hypothetical protein
MRAGFPALDTVENDYRANADLSSAGGTFTAPSEKTQG